jgi:hypothetical protein
MRFKIERKWIGVVERHNNVVLAAPRSVPPQRAFYFDFELVWCDLVNKMV